MHVSFQASRCFIADPERSCLYVQDGGASIDLDIAKRFAASDALLAACHQALFAMGEQGANADTSHPLRAAWESCRAAIDQATR